MASRSTLETEVKLRIGNPRRVEQQLRALGARPRTVAGWPAGRVFEHNIVYDTPDGDLRRCGCLLRLRILTPADGAGHRGRSRPSAIVGAGSRAVLTAKTPERSAARRDKAQAARGGRARASYKQRMERECEAGNPEALSRRLRALGFQPRFRYEKYRSSFRGSAASNAGQTRGGVELHMDLDETPVGNFLELEGSPRPIDRVAAALGFSPKDYIRSTYWDLHFARFRARRRFRGGGGQDPGHMVF